MILADKIIKLRKKNGWSQEELAEKMNVSRQAVSKWEAAQAVPDLDRILQLSKLFGVTTDYLLKDEISDEEFTGEDTTDVRRVTLTEAHEYIKSRKSAAWRIGVATLMCIASVIPMMLFAAAAEYSIIPIKEELAGVLGLSLLLVFVAIAVAIYITTGFKNAPYEFLEKEPFETEYGVTSYVTEQKKAYNPSYARNNIIATVMCILSPIPLVACASLNNEKLTIAMLCVMLLIIGIAVLIFIVSGVKWAALERLLKNQDIITKPSDTQKGTLKATVDSVYWSVVIAAYFAWSFIGSAWGISWVIWPIAAVLFPAVMGIVSLIEKKKNK